MADITKCNGQGCDPRGSCRRFTEPSSASQSYAAFDIQRGECILQGLAPVSDPCGYYISNERPFTDSETSAEVTYAPTV